MGNNFFQTKNHIMKKNITRRQFVTNIGKASVAAGLATTVIPALAKNFIPRQNSITYQQQPLPYAYNALEKAIDAQTMDIHYTKHAAAYAKNLSEAVEAENVDTKTVPIETLLMNISKYSTKMRNNGGGHYNHELFWQSMSPNSTEKPSGKLGASIEKDFGSFEAFKNQFNDTAKNRFGSGWAWLVVNGDKKLIVTSTPNQDNPLMDIAEVKGFPVFGLDVWEHAYYLRYQNKRPDYINNWWSVANWNFIEKRFEDFI
jgi:Fe-Mn family superoxide dismutase